MYHTFTVKKLFQFVQRKPNKYIQNIKMDKLKEYAVMRVIFNALQDGYSVKKNDDGTYSFIRNKDVKLSSFIKNCLK